MNTNSVEKINRESDCNLLKTYNKIEKTFSSLMGEALNEFWEMGIDYKLVEVSEEQGFFFSGSEYFVTRIKLEKDEQFVIKISKETVQILLDMVLGFNPNFEFEKITELEAKILKAFSNFVYEKFSAELFTTEEKTDLTGNLNFTFFLKNLTETPSKILISIPKSYIKFEEVICEEEKFSLDDFPEINTTAGFYIGSTALPLNDIKNLEKEDIIILENSNINNMTLLFGDEKAGFTVSPEPALIVSFDNDEGNKTMSKSDNIWDNIQVDITAEFEGVKISLGEIKQISEGLVIDMGSLYENKVFLKVEDKKIAEGELVIINDRYGVKVEKIINEDNSEDEDFNSDEETDTEDFNDDENEDFNSEDNEENEDIEENSEEENNEEFDYKDFDVDDENI